MYLFYDVQQSCKVRMKYFKHMILMGFVADRCLRGVAASGCGGIEALFCLDVETLMNSSLWCEGEFRALGSVASILAPKVTLYTSTPAFPPLTVSHRHSSIIPRTTENES